MREVRIAVGDGDVSASVHGNGSTALVLGHGAGGDRRTRFLVSMAESLAVGDRVVVLYNFPYSERRRRVPDRPEVLEATARAVGEHARAELRAVRLAHGGKSMGGRIASQVVARGAPADALVFLGYPLHPPGRTETRRDVHLPSVPCPMLFVQGTRDAFARWDLLQGTVDRLGEKATLHVIDGGDHSFAVPRSSGRTKADVEEDVRRAVAAWLEARGL